MVSPKLLTSFLTTVGISYVYLTSSSIVVFISAASFRQHGRRLTSFSAVGSCR
ncbi:hypothetical protein BU16DRAFT_520937 [Lophium mytilinum]|uniref:Uncharacterized protein n=1 Tax=Lophium mytilinum TaxID=390894 RepID=A0A6A6RB84_9PEZI|nr:hypothetical protein BU16DRAFT_520937 [Lophium mytilinum]